MDLNEINELRDAIKASPDNIPLRKYLAKSLMKIQRHEEAELEYKNALKQAPNDLSLKLGLAEAFCEQEKTSLGLVIIEELVEGNAPAPKAWLVYARLLMQAKNPNEAKDAYQNAVALDDNLKDAFLESQINLSQQEGTSPEPQKIKIGGKEFDEDEAEKSIDIERPETTFSDVG